jgi:hypothetical protein
VGGSNWAPVHRFCVAAKLPCLFPNVDLPVVAEADFYPVYLSRGVLLEADLLAAELARRVTDGDTQAPLRRVVQVVRRGDVGEAAARALQHAAATLQLKFELRSLPAQSADQKDVVLQATRDLAPGDALVLWLRAPDLAALAVEPPPAALTLVSGTLAGLERAPLPEAWYKQVRMSYPFDLPQARQVRMNYPLGWFKIKQIPVVAERVQTDTYVACGILAETLNDMLDSFVRDYLVERVEVMLGHRLVNGYYPRLSLGPGQRFASKGGYVVRFADGSGTALAPGADWTVP